MTPAERPDGPWRIAVVEDHLLQRRRTEELIGAQRGLEVVRSVETLDDLVTWLDGIDSRALPHLIILDLVVDRGRDADPERVAALVDAGIHVLVLSAMASPPLVRAMLRSGIDGVVGKRDEDQDIISAIWSILGKRQWMSAELAAVIAGDDQRPGLSRQEERVLVLYASGLTISQVAERIGVSTETARTYLGRVKRKYAELGRTVRSKVDLTRAATVDGLIDLGEAPRDD